jgi:hypothetical protein
MTGKNIGRWSGSVLRLFVGGEAIKKCPAPHPITQYINSTPKTYPKNTSQHKTFSIKYLQRKH